MEASCALGSMMQPRIYPRGTAFKAGEARMEIMYVELGVVHTSSSSSSALQLLESLFHARDMLFLAWRLQSGDVKLCELYALVVDLPLAFAAAAAGPFSGKSVTPELGGSGIKFPRPLSIVLVSDWPKPG